MEPVLRKRTWLASGHEGVQTRRALVAFLQGVSALTAKVLIDASLSGSVY